MDKNLQYQSKASATRTLQMGTKMDCGGETKRYSEKCTLKIHVPGHNEEASNKWYQCDNASPYAGSIVGKKWEPRNPVPGPFSAKIRKVNQNSESRREFGK